MKWTIVFFIGVFLFAPRGLLAQGGVPLDLLVRDDEFYNGTAWGAETIERFMRSLGGALPDRRFVDTDGVERPASAIIARAAEMNTINPKVLLATLQKEQSLLEDPRPSQDQLDWATGFGVCDACRHDDPGIQKFRGFATQIESAAASFRYYRDHASEFRYRTLVPAVVDGVTVIPQNQATAALLNYTPHLAGNIRFMELWRRYFMKKYTEGNLLQVPGENIVWYIQYGRRRPIYSRSVLASRFDPRTVITAGRAELELYPEGTPVQFPQYAIIRVDKKHLSLLQDDIRRRIPSMKVFRAFGFSPAEILDVDARDLLAYGEGKPLTERDIYPTGALIESGKDVYYVRDGIKYPIIDRMLLTLRFPGRPTIKAKHNVLDTYTLGEPLGLPDGTLAKAKSKKDQRIYIIDGGMKRSIASPDIFRDRGYQWKNVKVIPDRVLAIHPLGTPIDF